MENAYSRRNKEDAIKEIKQMIEKGTIQFVDLRFTDLPGAWQHFSIPAKELKDSGIWDEGIGFDGSSIRGFQEIHESDMILHLDPTTAFIDPIFETPTLSLICDIYDPINKEPYNRDPRYIARKAEKYLKKTGVADESFWGPELEFFIFGDVRFDQSHNSAYYFVDSREGAWNSGKDEQPNLGYKPRYKEGYFPVPPHDSLQDLRSEIVLALEKTGVSVEVHHHEVATAGQCEIDMRYAPLLKMADNCLLYKYMVKNIAKKHRLTATFMPKPLFGDNGTGMHVHQSLWKDGTPIFFEKGGYADLSQTALYYIGGLLAHAPALLAFCSPTTNSYKRLVPGYEAPVNIVYSARNRSAAVRIPMYSDNPKAKRIEFRPPDPSANPYLAFAAMLLAGIDGIKKKTDPGTPFEGNTYNLKGEEAKKIKTVPGSLSEALDALKKDSEFLLEGGVFTQDVIETWLDYKSSKEVDAVRLRPHPYEFALYYDI